MTTEAPDTPGSRLRKARERLGLQQIELGRKLGVSGSYISRIERDLVKIQPMVLRLAKALDVSVDYLLVLRDTPQRDATGTALYESTQDELVALRPMRLPSASPTPATCCSGASSACWPSPRPSATRRWSWARGAAARSATIPGAPRATSAAR
jgi:transcriptional regulator with XRE-family HTH domain